MALNERRNPYNSSQPADELFTGYEEEVRRLRRGLRNGRSYALLGGRRCGKTSFLHRLQRDIVKGGLRDYQALPRFFDVRQDIPHSTSDFWRTVASLLVSDLGVKQWPGAEGSQPYKEFLSYLEDVEPQLEKQYGSSWLAVVLIDDIDVAAHFLPDDECFHNLRSLLQTPRYARHFRVVATGVAGLSHLIQAGSPLINILEPFSLRCLNEDEALELVAKGFKLIFPSVIETALVQQTGGHPYLLQGVLELLWEESEPIDEVVLQEAVSQFVRNHEGVFRRWLEDIGHSGFAIYKELAQAAEGPPSVARLHQLVRPGDSVDGVLSVMSYHGLIAGSRLRIAGTLFRDWFSDNDPPGRRSTVLVCYSDRDAQSPRELQTHLKPLERAGKVERLNDSRMRVGDLWLSEVRNAIDQAKVVVLLVSASFLASDFINEEKVGRLLAAAATDGTVILPVFLSPCAYDKIPLLARLQGVNDPSKTLSEMTRPQRQRVWVDLVGLIEKALA